jgi:hypothetical protein
MAQPILWELASGRGFDPVGEFVKGREYREQQDIKANRRSILEQLALGPDGNLDAKAGLTQLVRAGDLQGAAQFAQTSKMLQPETTDEIKEYNLFRQQGGNLPFTEWKIKIKTASAPKINNVINTGDNKYAQTLGEADAKGFIGLNQSGANAQSKLNTLSALDNLMKDPNFYSGFAGPTKMRATQALTSLGIANPNAASAQETFNALSQKFVLDLAGGSLGTGFSNADRDFLQGQVPNLQSTPEGNQRLIGYMRAVAKREQQVADLARKYAAQNKGRFDQSGFNNFITQWAEQNPLFPQAQRQQQQTLPAPQQRQRQTPAPPQIGEIRNGYRFRGGNPADQNAWEPAQ